MNLSFYKPAPVLQSYIKLYAFFDIPGEACPERIKFIPSGSPYIVMNLKDSFLINNNLVCDHVVDKKEIIVGQQDTYYYLKPEGNYASVCVILQPTGFYRLLHVPINQIINFAIPLNDCIRKEADILILKIKETINNIPHIVKLLDNYFYNRLIISDFKYTYIEYTLNQIIERKGIVNVQELANIANTSLRNFRRRFTEIVGISPKKFIQIVRLSNILRMIKSNQCIDFNWASISYNSGYFDQMHFIKEFKRFCGETPAKYLSNYQNKYDQVQKYFLYPI